MDKKKEVFLHQCDGECFVGFALTMYECTEWLSSALSTHLHWVDSDGEGRIIPVHLILFSVLLVPHGALVGRSDTEDAQDDHKHQEAHAYNDNNGGSAGDNCEDERTQIRI